MPNGLRKSGTKQTEPLNGLWSRNKKSELKIYKKTKLYVLSGANPTTSSTTMAMETTVTKLIDHNGEHPKWTNDKNFDELANARHSRMEKRPNSNEKTLHKQILKKENYIQYKKVSVYNMQTRNYVLSDIDSTIINFTNDI